MKVIRVPKTKNLRDIGGKYENVTIRFNMLLRGRVLPKLNKRGKRILTEKHHLRTIIDVRDKAEREQVLDTPIEGVKNIAMPVFDEEKVGISRADRETKDKITLLKMLPPMEQLYYEMLHDSSLKNLSKIIHYLISAPSEDYSIYFHCSEGKDRTGIISAIILLILGVSRKEIVEEYLYTNKAARSRAIRYYLLAKYVRFDVLLAKRLKGMFTANKNYIQVLFNVIDNEYGNESKFFKDGLKLTDIEIENFRKKMIIK